jgi:hypothetical protein
MRPRVSRPLAEYYSDTMTNRFGLPLPPDRLRWAVAEGVSEDVICAVLLLHEHSVERVAPKLRPVELEQRSCWSAEIPDFIRPACCKLWRARGQYYRRRRPQRSHRMR